MLDTPVYSITPFATLSLLHGYVDRSALLKQRVVAGVLKHRGDAHVVVDRSGGRDRPGGGRTSDGVPVYQTVVKGRPVPPEAVAASTLMLVLPRACWLLSSAVGTALPAKTLMMPRAPAPVFSPARHDPSIPAAAVSRSAIAKMADVFMFHPLSFAERRDPHRPKYEAVRTVLQRAIRDS